MSFCETLNQYMKLFGCSGRELAGISGVSKVTISRYLKGERAPKSDSEILRKLSVGLSRISEKTDSPLDSEQIFSVLSSAAGLEPEINYKAFLSNLRSVLSTLEISNNELARELNYDPSYISRILSGQRKPADVMKFTSSVAAYISERYLDFDLASLSGSPLSADFARSSDNLISQIVSRLCSNEFSSEPEPIYGFLEMLDDFDLNEYYKKASFYSGKAPCEPPNLPQIKYYRGIDEMKQCELDFLNLTAAFQSGGEVFLYTDMPMKAIEADPEYAQKWILGMETILKNGTRLNIIHDVNRPLSELFIGLETYVPMYMTGLITPYYLKKYQGDVFLHTLRVSDCAAVTGTAIAGNHSNGRCEIFREKNDVDYYRSQAKQLIKKAFPLIKIYRADRQEEFDKAVSSMLESGDISMSLAGLPLFTIDPKLLNSILLRNGVGSEIRDKILRRRETELLTIENALINSRVSLEIPLRGDIENVTLPVCSVFYDKIIKYSAEEYKAHLNSTREFAAERKGFRFSEVSTQSFRNIHITVSKGKGVIITKGNAPTIHFIVTHPKLVSAIEDFILLQGD